MPKVAVVQLRHSISVKENRQKLMAFAAQAADQGADVICFSELCTSHYFCTEESDDNFALAEPIPGPTTEEMAAIARSRGVAVVVPVFEREVSGEFYNSAAVIDRSGELVGRYRKSSIPVMKTDEGVSNEKYYFKPGNLGFPTFALAGGPRIAIIICYDRHFPEAFRTAALGGAEVVFVPTASSRGRLRSMWEIELRAHAFQNLFFVAGVNRVGIDDGGARSRDHFGSSLIINPYGEVIAAANDRDEGVVCADVDLKLVGEARARLGFLRDRRPDAYGLVAR